MNTIELNELNFNYHNNQAFSININHFTLSQNEHVLIEGPSGCGKTTLLNLITGLVPPNKGTIHVLGTNITKLNRSKKDQFRANHFGIIFQLFNLIPHLSVIENIILPCTFSKKRKLNALKMSKTLEEDAIRLCDSLDISRQQYCATINQLSIGEQQRVAIARALIGQPEVIIADEPTSALDDHRSTQFMDLLLNACKTNNMSLMFVSHNESLKKLFKKRIQLSIQTN